MHMQPFQFQGPPGDKLGWEQRIVKWADDYLKKLRGGTLAYPHETGAGKPQAQSLRGFLLSRPVLAVLKNSGVNTSYGNSMRLSAEDAHTARVIPQQDQARQQYYLDLFADDVALLERIKSMLGSQPVLEKEAVWTTFGKVFTELDRSFEDHQTNRACVYVGIRVRGAQDESRRNVRAKVGGHLGHSAGSLTEGRVRWAVEVRRRRIRP